MSALADVQQIVAGHMDDILKCFKAGAKITVLVRTPDKPTADFMMTDDDPAEAIALIQRRLAEAIAAQPGLTTAPIRRLKALPWKSTGSEDAPSFMVDTKLGRFAYGLDLNAKAWWHDPDGEHEAGTSIEAAKRSAEAAYEASVYSAFFTNPAPGAPTHRRAKAGAA